MSIPINFVGTTIERNPQVLPALLAPIVKTDDGHFFVGGSNPLEGGRQVSQAWVDVEFAEERSWPFDPPLRGVSGQLVLDFDAGLQPKLVEPSDLPRTLLTLSHQALNEAERALKGRQFSSLATAIDRLFFAVGADPNNLFSRLALLELLYEDQADAYLIADYEDRVRKAPSETIRKAIRYPLSWPAICSKARARAEHWVESPKPARSNTTLKSLFTESDRRWTA
jgi:hypothetical protein